jgi:hypothetical protein
MTTPVAVAILQAFQEWINSDMVVLPSCKPKDVQEALKVVCEALSDE